LIRDMIEQNIDMKCKDISKLVGITDRRVQQIKKDIEKEEKERRGLNKKD